MRLCATVRGSPVVTPDETGWKVGGHPYWLWAFATPDTTTYAIEDGRGFAQAARMLGADYAGVLQRDGWAPYRQFVHAAHQTCVAHLLRRCRTMMLDHPHHPFAPQVQALLQAALATRDRYRLGQVSDQGLAVARGHYVNRLDRLLPTRPSRLANARRFAAHLRTEFEAVFSFLFDPTLDATNWRAEHAFRPAVITRKCAAVAIARFGAPKRNRSWPRSSEPLSNAASTRPPSLSLRCGRRGPSSSTPFNQLRYTDPLNRDKTPFSSAPTALTASP